MTRNYYLDGIRLRDLGVFVTESSGWLGLAKPKQPLSESYRDTDGVELYGKQHLHDESREIRLRITLIPTEGYSLVQNIKRLNALLTTDKPLIRLEVEMSSGERVGYDVYRSAELDYKLLGDDEAATAELKLNAPKPSTR